MVVDERLTVDVPVPPDDSPTLAGFTEMDSPDEGDTEVDRLMVPAKLLRLPKFMVDDAEPPVENEILAGVADRVKSPTPTVTVVV